MPTDKSTSQPEAEQHKYLFPTSKYISSATPAPLPLRMPTLISSASSSSSSRLARTLGW
ncbi:hypothetical protein COCHEDRAFT_1021703 [Bipolaris maydis C5]|uniref:Uncharacterized protein n=1 Tax=Cochliobolus heterostrophus (strain C5 / ATCC 48332 / race O) TaxID=701091 RepID=M2SZX8_COCH5|nr:hypothetical protein COCHEDRAFT_1021703 [Bipolaris maydis C5]